MLDLFNTETLPICLEHLLQRLESHGVTSFICFYVIVRRVTFIVLSPAQFCLASCSWPEPMVLLLITLSITTCWQPSYICVFVCECWLSNWKRKKSNKNQKKVINDFCGSKNEQPVKVSCNTLVEYREFPYIKRNLWNAICNWKMWHLLKPIAVRWIVRVHELKCIRTDRVDPDWRDSSFLMKIVLIYFHFFIEMILDVIIHKHEPTDEAVCNIHEKSFQMVLEIGFKICSSV